MGGTNRLLTFVRVGRRVLALESKSCAGLIEQPVDLVFAAPRARGKHLTLNRLDPQREMRNAHVSTKTSPLSLPMRAFIKATTLITDTGLVLMKSSVILQYLATFFPCALEEAS